MAEASWCQRDLLEKGSPAGLHDNYWGYPSFISGHISPVFSQWYRMKTDFVFLFKGHLLQIEDIILNSGHVSQSLNRLENFDFMSEIIKCLLAS